MKTKRGVFCSCGSGKRYSNCCLSQKKIVIFDPRWQKIRKTAKEVIHQHLFPYVKTLGVDLMHEAWLEFWGEHRRDLPKGVLRDCLETVFIPWALFQRDLNGEGAIALQYLKYNKSLSDDKQHFIQAASKAQYSFYRVLDTIPGLHLVLDNLLWPSHHIVKEPKLSEILITEDILFILLFEMEGYTFYLGMSPFCIPSNYYQSLIEFNKDLHRHSKSSSSSLKQSSIEIKEEFFRILKSVLNKKIRKENEYGVLN